MSIYRVKRPVLSNPLFAPLFATGSLVYFCAQMLLKSVSTSLVFTMIFLISVVIFILYKYWQSLSKPLVEVFEDEIHVQSYWGTMTIVKPFHEYSFVISTDFCAFRKGTENDIFIYLGLANRHDREYLISYFKKLNFLSIIGNDKTH